MSSYPEDEPLAEAEPSGEPEGEPESEGGSTAQLCSFITVYSLIIVLIVCGNIVVATILIKRRLVQKNVCNIYLLSLVLARIMIGLLVVPARITGLFSEEYIKSAICKLCHYAGHGSSVASVLSIIGIAISTYWQIVRGENLFKKLKSNAIVIGMIWITAFLYSIKSPVTNDLIVFTIESGDHWSCTVSPDYYWFSRYMVLGDCCVMFIVPFLIIVFCYVGVIRKLANQVKKSKQTAIEEQQVRDSLLKIRMIVTLMCLFTICSLAPVSCNMYLAWNGEPFEHLDIIQTTLYMFSYSNAWYNIIVFFIFRQDLRTGLKVICGCDPQSKLSPECQSQEAIVSTIQVKEVWDASDIKSKEDPPCKG